MNIILLAISAALVNNVILSQFMGICPFLGVSKKVSTAAGMGGAVIFVITLSSFVTSVIYKLILQPLDLTYLHGIQRLCMTFRCNTCTALCIHNDGNLREKCLYYHGIGNDTDIRTETNQCYAFYRLLICQFP